MTPKSDHEEDMSMEEILASIRKFVTDSAPEEPRQRERVYKGDLAESVVVPPASHSVDHRQNTGGSSSQISRQRVYKGDISEPAAPLANHFVEQDQEIGRDYPLGQPVERQSPRLTPSYESETLELNRPILPTRPNSGLSSREASPPSPRMQDPMGQEESVMTLTNPIETKQEEKPPRLSSKISSSVGGQEANLGSSHTVTTSANALSRLAQASKSMSHKKNSALVSQRDVTLDQLIQDMIRPMIKLWIDTHLPSLVEEMVAKEIKRITDHLK